VPNHRKPVDEPPEVEDAPVHVDSSPVDERPDHVDDYPSLVEEDPVEVGEPRDEIDLDAVDQADVVDEDPDAVGQADVVDDDSDVLDEDPDAVDEGPDSEEEHPRPVAKKAKSGGRTAPSRPAEDRSGKDTRRGKRVKVSGIATLETGGLNATNQAVCTVRDLSRSGIGLETGQPPEVGQVVRLRLVLNGAMVTLSTIATRVDRRANSNFYQVGLDWSRCKPDELAFLDEVLNAVEPPERVKSKPRR
jgi:hypothetical protein